MTDITDLHAQALKATGAIVAGIPPGRWHDTTPCPGWDVRALVSHVVAGNLWAAELAAGATITDVGGRFDRDVLGTGAAGAYAQSAAAAAAAFRLPVPSTHHAPSPTARLPGRSTPGTGSSTCSCTAGTWPPRPARTPRWTPA